MGLEKWIDQQLHPESIDDSALDTRLQNYPTLDMSARKLLEEFPPPKQAAKQAGETKDEYKQQNHPEAPHRDGRAHRNG